MGLFSSFKTSVKESLPWEMLSNVDQLNATLELSTEVPVLFFKHSTRCSISSMALSRFESNWKPALSPCAIYFVDLLAYRSVSNALAELTGVEHQSPQVIVVKNNKVIYNESHSAIDAKEIQQLIVS